MSDEDLPDVIQVLGRTIRLQPDVSCYDSWNGVHGKERVLIAHNWKRGESGFWSARLGDMQLGPFKKLFEAIAAVEKQAEAEPELSH